MFVICTYIALLVNCILSTFYVGIVIQRDGRLRHQQAQGGAHRPAERLHAGGRRQAAAPRRHRQGTSIKDFCTGEEEGVSPNAARASTVCPKVAYNSFHMVFSAISGWILKPFDLQVATMSGFDIMYDKPVLSP